VTGDSIYISDYNTGNIRIISGLNLTGIQDININKGNLLTFPNPTFDMVNIKTDLLNIQVDVYSIDGKLLMQVNKKSFSIESLENGLYLLKITSDKNAYTGKVLKL
jgi:hypothetical protein